MASCLELTSGPLLGQVDLSISDTLLFRTPVWPDSVLFVACDMP